MCFYDQDRYACGDYKWGQLRQHCNREDRIGENCSSKMIMSTIQVRKNCRHCETYITKRRRIRQGRERIIRWSREPGRSPASIERSQDTICRLQREIDQLARRLRLKERSRNGLNVANETSQYFEEDSHSSQLPIAMLNHQSQANDFALSASATSDGTSHSNSYTFSECNSIPITPSSLSLIGNSTGRKPPSTASRVLPSLTQAYPPPFSTLLPVNWRTARSPQLEVEDLAEAELLGRLPSVQNYNLDSTPQILIAESQGPSQVSSELPPESANLLSAAQSKDRRQGQESAKSIVARTTRKAFGEVLQTLGLIEPPVEAGKSRVRWKCVSQPRDERKTRLLSP